jgi:hypothetical protein
MKEKEEEGGIGGLRGMREEGEERVERERGGKRYLVSWMVIKIVL